MNEKPKTSATGIKDDYGKPRWDLLDYEALNDVVKVMTRGVKIYDERSGLKENWKNVFDPYNRYFAAVMRHLTAWKTGEKNDKDSNLPHLAHAISNLLFLCHFDRISAQKKEN